MIVQKLKTIEKFINNNNLNKFIMNDANKKKNGSQGSLKIFFIKLISISIAIVIVINRARGISVVDFNAFDFFEVFFCWVCL